MTTLYIAGPMAGLPDYNYPAFHEAENALRAAGYDVLNPAAGDPPAEAEAKPWEWCLRRDLRMLLEANAVALLPGWAKSRGAQVEVRVAKALRMRLWSVDSWLDLKGRAWSA